MIKMSFLLILLIILIILLAILAGRIIFEITHPEISHYSVRTGKMSDNDKVRIVFLSDLHARQYGKNNSRLLRMVAKTKPDFILLGGDMVTASLVLNMDARVEMTIEALTNIAPVYYAPGNHEKKLNESERQSERYRDYISELECMDVVYLKDRNAVMTEEMYVYGLDIDERFYRKFGKADQMPDDYIPEKLGFPDSSKYNILMAHNPAYFDEYVRAGYDLVLCGHYHGGMVILPKYGGLISPEFKFFPEHSGGMYKKSGTIVVVSRGIGLHFINIRLFNRPEIVVINIKNGEKKKTV